MLPALTLLLVFQLIGEAARLALGLPVPGPVIGLALLLGWLILRGGPSADLRGTTGGLLQHLSLLFVPAGTGVMLHVGRIGQEWLPIVVSLVVSTVIGLAVGGWVLHTLMQRAGRQEQSR
ncbi:CidA/LrgA family protein [Cognatazoarcus halotolerans]|uniref:CidA/LrgA family protein n=1 Tax=Cognatazoarcus halotolerans TaxID=2686016 RepID=UPI00135C0011|nr:CidA/LrgA family protein [Cognatazoarcus halotolerans]MCB1900402.1 CidA/LrgA family protein [Rhodocyclaceae bacterium]MCP5311645.1 CidA/LrgA family protein [Zoogloeaceae bacterium]